MFKKPVKLVRKNRKTGAIIGQISLNDFLKAANEITPKRRANKPFPYHQNYTQKGDKNNVRF